MANDLRFKKVKITTENKVNIIYEKISKTGSWDEYAFSCSELARPEFYDAMKNLAEHVIEMCELPKNYIDRIDVRGVSFSYGGDQEVMGATISAQMKIDNSNCNLNLNTPHKASDSYSEGPGDDKQLLSCDCIKALDGLQKEAKLYIDGDRAQGKLFDVA